MPLHFKITISKCLYEWKGKWMYVKRVVPENAFWKGFQVTGVFLNTSGENTLHESRGVQKPVWESLFGCLGKNNEMHSNVEMNHQLMNDPFQIWILIHVFSKMTTVQLLFGTITISKPSQLLVCFFLGYYQYTLVCIHYFLINYPLKYAETVTGWFLCISLDSYRVWMYLQTFYQQKCKIYLKRLKF